MAIPFMTAVPPMIEGAVARKSAKDIIFMVGEQVIFQIAINEAKDFIASQDWGDTTKGLITNTMDRVPNAIKDGVDDETLGNEIANWIIDTLNEATQGVEDEIVDFINGDLVLNFGRDSFSAEGKVKRPRYDFNGATAALLMDDDEDKWEAVAPPLMLEGSNGDAALHFDIGLTVIIAASGVGKTTFCRNVVKYLVNLEGSDNVGVNYVSWNEREYYSSGGSPSDLVDRVDQGTNSADVFMLDSVRDFTLGGSGSAGYRGMNTEFFVQLTQWHHAFRKRNVSGFVIVNPILRDDDFITQLEEVIRGSVNGFLHIKRPGEGVYEHVRTGRRPVNVKLPADGWVDFDSKGFNPIEGPETVVIDKVEVAVDEFEDVRNYFTN